MDRQRNGQFGLGVSGNPGGRPKVVAEVRDLAREHTTEAIKTLLSIMNDDDKPPAARVAAAVHILDRAYGKATASVDVRQGRIELRDIAALVEGLDCRDEDALPPRH